MIRLGLIGWPVGHSLSPRIFQSLAQKLKIKLTYRAIPLPPAELEGELESLKADGYAGLSVTIPHKQAVIPLLDALTPEARSIGAVNAIRFARAGSQGHNTDASGFLEALVAAGFPTGEAVLFGAGGAARAVGWALGQAKARRVRISARRTAPAKALAADLNKLFPRTDFSAGPEREASLWINATPLGMEGFADESPARKARCAFAYDLVYGRKTAFLRQAAAAGARTEDGLSMLVLQALSAWEFWTKPLGGPRKSLLAAAIKEELQ